MCQFFDDFGNYSGGSLRLRRLDNHGFEVAWRALICALPYHDPFDAVRDGGEDFVGDGAEDLGKFLNARVVTEDGDSVTNLHVKSGHIQHTHIHTDIADGRSPVPSYAETCGATAQMTVAMVVPPGAILPHLPYPIVPS